MAQINRELMSSNTTPTQTPMDIAQPIIHAVHETDTATQSFDETVTFTDDELVVTTTESFITENTSVTLSDLAELTCARISEEESTTRVTITFKLWMAVRRATRAEFEAAKQGITDVQNNTTADPESLSDIETRYYEFGRTEGTNSTDNPETVLSGRIPQVIMYHRDNGYSGPKHHGNAFNYNRVTEFDPDEAGTIITDVNEVYSITTHEFPDIECEAEDGTVHRFSYWVDD